MPDFEITSPEGKRFIVTAPEGASQDQVLSYARTQADMQRMADPMSGMSGTQKVLAGAGKAFADVGRGIGQVTGLTPQSSIDEAKRLDAPLMRSGAGMAGNIAGNAALFAPTAMIPGANTYTGAALAGSAMGALQPLATGQSRGINAALGAGAGIAGQGIGNVLGRLLRPVASSLSPEEQALAAAASKEGIPLSAGQRTGSRPLQIAESVFENLPVTSKSQLAGHEVQQRAFTAAALRRAGMEGDSAGAQALIMQKQDLGGELGRIASSNRLDFNQGLTDRLANIVGEASSKLPPAEASRIAGTVDQILSQVEPHGAMRGTNYQGWREPLRDLADNTATGRYYGRIRQAMDDAFSTQLKGAEAETFKSTSRQYANLKTIIDAMGGPGKLPATGQLAPAQLAAALTRSMGREGKALGRGDLNELSRVGQLFVKDQIPNSGTAQRGFIQNLLTGNLPGAAAGAGVGYYEGRTPEAAALGALAGTGISLGGPKLAQAVMNSKLGQKYLAEGLVALSPTQRAALSNILRTGAISAAPELTQ